MQDDRLWGFEQSLWLEGRENYREKVDAQVVMVLPRPPHVLAGEEAIAAVIATPVWDRADLTERRVARPQEGLIVVAYHVHASKADHTEYKAWCTSVYRRLSHEVWQVVQHQQTPVKDEDAR